MAEPSRAPVARAVLQQCLSAALQVKAAEPGAGAAAEWVQVQRGLVIYICFFRGANEELIPKMVNTLLNVKLSETESGKYVSVLDLPGSVLIIPQATLGGRLKGRNMQYHNNTEKEKGMELYSQFVTQCEKELAANTKCAEAGVVVRNQDKNRGVTNKRHRATRGSDPENPPHTRPWGLLCLKPEERGRL